MVHYECRRRSPVCIASTELKAAAVNSPAPARAGHLHGPVLQQRFAEGTSDLLVSGRPGASLSEGFRCGRVTGRQPAALRVLLSDLPTTGPTSGNS